MLHKVMQLSLDFSFSLKGGEIMGIYRGTHAVQQVYRSNAVDRVYLGTKRIFPDILPETQWLYSSDGTGITLLLYLGTDKAISVPDRMDGLPVTALAPTACNYCCCNLISLPASLEVLA